MLPGFAGAEGAVRTKVDGKLVMEDVPEIPRDILVCLMRYENIRAAVNRLNVRGSAGYGKT